MMLTPIDRLARLVRLTLLALVLSTGTSCENGTSDAKHEVFFVGYVYDGATGKRLAATDLTAISIKYRDQIIHTKIESDGRFMTTDALPTWQDYSVYVGAQGYRPFVSDNPGIDVPKAVQMTEGVSSKGTVQTFDFVVRLFPMALAAPKVTITIEKGDALVVTPTPARATGTLRLTPISASVIQQGSDTGTRVWANDEDLLTQTITKTFMDGSVEIPGTDLVYGVNYQVAVFGVDGYQPFPGSSFSSSSSNGVVSAGAVTSLFVTLQPDGKAPLRLLGTNADKCMPPVPTSTTYGAAIDLTFSEEIEPAGPTFAEDVDNGVSILVGSSTSSFCPLNPSGDPAKQERGTKATINGRVLTLSFNPSIGLSIITSFGTTCMTPAALTAVVYGLNNVLVQPKGDPVRKVTVGALLAQIATTSTFPTTSSTSISCPVHPVTSTQF